MRLFSAIVLASVVTAGCATIPPFDRISGVTPKTIVDVIECEIIAAKQKNARRVARESLRRLRGDLPIDYPTRDLRLFYAVAELTLQVDEQLTLAPTFTHTDVVSKSLTRIFDWGVKLDTQSQRVYSESVTFNIGGMADEKERCKDRPPGISLNGKLGIAEVVDMAFGSIDPDDQGIDFPEGATDGGNEGGLRKGPGTKTGVIRGGKKSKGGGAFKGGGGKSGGKNAFGTSIEFSIVGAVTPSGPTWSLVTFKGPGKLFSAQRVDTHKVTISFALTPENAGLHNLILSNATLPTTITRRIDLRLQQ